MSDVTYTPGVFVWRELMTSDVGRARAFYSELLGWSFQDAPMGDFTYTLIQSGEKQIGGMAPLDPSAGHPPHWMSYVSVDDVDAAAERAKQSGGSVPVGPMDIPNVGRFAVVGDRDGAYFSLFKSAQGDLPQSMPGVGAFCWETLSAKDVDGAKQFYEAVVGWKVGPGPGGNPDVPVFRAGEAQVADVQKAEHFPPHWLTYVVVGKLEEARDRVEPLGGKVVVPLIEVPHVGRIALIADPTGAHIGLFEPQMG